MRRLGILLRYGPAFRLPSPPGISAAVAQLSSISAHMARSSSPTASWTVRDGAIHADR